MADRPGDEKLRKIRKLFGMLIPENEPKLKIIGQWLVDTDRPSAIPPESRSRRSHQRVWLHLTLQYASIISSKLQPHGSRNVAKNTRTCSSHRRPVSRASSPDRRASSRIARSVSASTANSSRAACGGRPESAARTRASRSSSRAYWSSRARSLAGDRPPRRSDSASTTWASRQRG